MPIITVQFIKDVVATPEQKRQIITRLTDVFVEIVGEVTRPFVYCMIKETPQMEWAIAGVPMPDLVYLTSDKHAQVIERSNELMRSAITQMQAASASTNGHSAQDAEADAIWRHEREPHARANDAQQRRQNRDQQADSIWRGGASAHSGHNTAEEHRRLFERWFEELWNKKNYNIAYELVDPGFIAHGAGGQDIRQGPDGVIEMVKAWHTAMPDGHMTIDDIITEGDLSTIRMTWRATHLGPFGNIPPSGNRIEVTSFGIDRVVNGKITEGWGEVNLLSMFQQMGAIPAPDSGGSSNGSNSAQTQVSTAVSPDEGRIQRNREIIHRFYEAVNTKNTSVFYEIVHPDFVNHGGASGDIVGPDALIESLQRFYDAMPDWHVSEDYVVAQGDRVASRGTITGTHLGSFMGLPPTGKHLTWTGIIIYRLDDDGRIIERWQDFDALGMLQQMGAIPAPGGAPQPAN